MSNFKTKFLEIANAVARDQSVPANQADHGDFLIATVDTVQDNLVTEFPHCKTRAEINGINFIIIADEDGLKQNDTFAVQYEIKDGLARYSRTYDFEG